MWVFNAFVLFLISFYCIQAHHLYGFFLTDLIFIFLLLVRLTCVAFRLKLATFWLIILFIHSFFFHSTNELVLVQTGTSFI